MAYGLKYQGSFDNLAEQPYHVEIYELDYAGDTLPLILSGTPVKHKWQTDEAIPAIQGSSVIVSYINDGTLPLISFYSNNDNQFKLKLFWDDNLIFEGFLVQDDCHELMVDYDHEVSLSFTDNLGILKDCPFNQGLTEGVFYLVGIKFDFLSPLPTDNCFIYLYNTDFIPQVGVPFQVANHIDPSANAYWTPTVVTNYFNGNWKVQVADFSFTDMVAWPSWISGFWTFNPYNRQTLLNIIGQCLKNTSLTLSVNIYANIFEDSHDTSRSFLEQTYVNCQVFLNGETWNSCYDVLTKILSRFGLTLFQAQGEWQIVRWQDMRQYATPFAIPGFIYVINNEYLKYSNTTTFANFFTAAFEGTIYPEVGLMNSIIRPWKFDEETFNYQQPKYLLKNWDLQDLGDLFGTNVVGSNTEYYYYAPDWYQAGVNLHDIYIVVVRVTTTQKEVERYMYIGVNAPGWGETGVAAQATPFEVQAKDNIKIEFTMQTNTSNPGPQTIQLSVYLTNGVDPDVWANDVLTSPWVTGGPAWSYSIPSGDNSNVEHNVVIEPGPIPNDGLLYIYLPQLTPTPSPGDRTYIKNIRLTYKPSISGVDQIIGQIQKSEQDETIKNHNQVTVDIDDSPKNSVQGTLFTTDFTNLIEDRTTEWFLATDTGTQVEFGELSTRTGERWRQVPRSLLQGNFIGMIQTNHISYLGIFTHGYIPDVNYIFGLLEIDYRSNSFNCTQYEIFKDGEDSDVLPDIDYTFVYIYSKD